MSDSRNSDASIRHDFYQTDSAVVVSVYKKNAPASEVTVQFGPRSARITLSGQEIFRLDPLEQEIDVQSSSYRVFGTKIELTLAKSSPSGWRNLVSSTTEQTKGPAIPATSSQPSALTSGEQTISGTTTDTATAKKKDWSRIISEVDENEPDSTPDDFFKRLYKDADEDTRRAMMKSYMESGGTTLSTNWSEVGKGKVEGTPPEGTEFRKW